MFTLRLRCKRNFEIKLGNLIKQPSSYTVYIPQSFPPAGGLKFSAKLINKTSQATLSLGKLDGITQLLPDVDDIIPYIESVNQGIKRLNEFPLSLRLIKEAHKTLMTDARTTHRSNPGNFRESQNWIGGTNLNNAIFCPSPC